MKNTITTAGAVALLTTAVSLASAQPSDPSMSREMGGVTNSQMGGEMPGHPHTKSSPGSKRPMSKEKDDPRMRGDMGDHPHQASGPSSKRPRSAEKTDPKMSGDMGDHPHVNSTSSTK